MNTTPSLLSVSALALVLAGCALSDTSTRDEARVLVGRGQWAPAWELLSNDPTQDPSDPFYKSVKVLALMERGQTAVFEERAVEAITIFEELLALEPGNETALTWLDKARHKLAEVATRTGDEHFAAGDLEEALWAYHKSFEHVPDYQRALAGVQKVADTVKRKKARAADQYINGVAALGEQLFGVTWYQMVNALGNDPSLSKAKALRDSMLERLIEQDYADAQQDEKDGYYRTALAQYRSLKLRRPELDGIDARIEQMVKEVECLDLIEKARMAGFRREYEKANELLLQADGKTALQKADVADLRILILERDLTDRYQEARILTLEQHLEQGLAIYKEINEIFEGFRDVKVLILGLEETIKAATKAFAEGQAAEQAGNIEEALEAYRSAALHYPGYKGLAAKIAALQAQIAAKAKEKAKANAGEGSKKKE